MKSVRYIGKYNAVEVEVAPARFQSVKRGEVLEVSNTIADGLLEQRDNWATPGAKRTRTRKAKSKSTPAPPATEPASTEVEAVTQEG